MSRRFIFAATAVAALSHPVASAAQIFMPEPVGLVRPGGWTFAIGAQMGEPLGDFRANVNQAWGAGGSLRYNFPGLRTLGVRGDFTYLNYGRENRRVPLSSTLNRVLVDMNTSNNIVVFSGGPELALPRGLVRPYVYAFAGYSYFYTETQARDDNSYDGFASSVNFDDGGLATGWGGGLRIPLHFRTVNAAIDAGVRHTKNGVRQYLRPGDIVDVPNGFIPNPRTSLADFRQWHVGVSFSPRGR